MVSPLNQSLMQDVFRSVAAQTWYAFNYVAMFYYIRWDIAHLI